MLALNQPAGIAVRIQEKTIGEVKKALQDFLPHFLKFDAGLHTEESYTVDLLFGLLKYHFKWTDI